MTEEKASIIDVSIEQLEEEAEIDAKVKKMSPKTFREWAELSLKYCRQRKEREESEALTKRERK
ncbi:hypothetical protein ES703_117182 [subsurface metagenome]